MSYVRVRGYAPVSGIGDAVSQMKSIAKTFGLGPVDGGKIIASGAYNMTPGETAAARKEAVAKGLGITSNHPGTSHWALVHGVQRGLNKIGYKLKITDHITDETWNALAKAIPGVNLQNRKWYEIYAAIGARVALMKKSKGAAAPTAFEPTPAPSTPPPAAPGGGGGAAIGIGLAAAAALLFL